MCVCFPIKVVVTLPILRLFCLFLVIFLSIGLCPFMMNYPEFFSSPFSFFEMSVVFGLSRRVFYCFSQKDRKKHDLAYVKHIVQSSFKRFALSMIHTATLAGRYEGRVAPRSPQHPQLGSNQQPRHTCENRCL